MHATAVVKEKSFGSNSTGRSTHRANRNKTMSEQEAIAFVESKRRARTLRRAKPYLESRP